MQWARQSHGKSAGGLALHTIFVVHAVLAGLALLWLVVHALLQWRRERASAQIVRLLGGDEHEPDTLHPVIDGNLCIGSAACVRACPEDKALVVVDGRARLADPGGCVGHGACRLACPVDAIELVFGSARRGVDLPMLTTEFQSSQPGIYIAGELGGMGLVANAVRQGVKAVEEIEASLAAEGTGPGPGPGAGAGADVLPLLIIGAGPAGLGATLAARARGLASRTLEREASMGGSVRAYPRGKIVMTHPVELPLYGHVRLRRTRKETLIELWDDVLRQSGVSIEFGRKLEGIERDGATLLARIEGEAAPVRARRVLLATGRRGRPRRLGVPGEAQAHVHDRLEDPAAHDGQACVVVGGGDSAIEAALALAERPGTRVVLSYRGERFVRAKPETRRRLEDAVAAGRVRVLCGSQVAEVAGDTVTLALAAGEREVVPAQVLFTLIGRDLEHGLLAAAGIEVRTFHGEGPRSRPTRPR